MKKLMTLAMVALLALGANVSAQEESASQTAAESTIGGIATSTVVIGAVAVGIAAAIISNNRSGGDPIECAADEILQNGACVCPAGETKVNGVCTPAPQLTCDNEVHILEGNICTVLPGQPLPGTTSLATVTTTYLATLQ